MLCLKATFSTHGRVEPCPLNLSILRIRLGDIYVFCQMLSGKGRACTSSPRTFLFTSCCQSSTCPRTYVILWRHTSVRHAHQPTERRRVLWQVVTSSKATLIDRNSSLILSDKTCTKRRTVGSQLCGPVGCLNRSTSSHITFFPFPPVFLVPW